MKVIEIKDKFFGFKELEEKYELIRCPIDNKNLCTDIFSEIFDEGEYVVNNEGVIKPKMLGFVDNAPTLIHYHSITTCVYCNVWDVNKIVLRYSSLPVTEDKQEQYEMVFFYCENTGNNGINLYSYWARKDINLPKIIQDL